MKKKTKTFFFFNQLNRNPASLSLFVFFMRALKQHAKTKLVLKLIRNQKNYLINQQSPKTIERIDRFKNYKVWFRYKFIYNNWIFNYRNLPELFVKSYYIYNFNKNESNPRSNIKHKIKLWFLIKTDLHKKLLKRLRYLRFVIEPEDTSATILLNKNKTGFVATKYRSKLFNLPAHNIYLNSYLVWLWFMLKYNLKKIFFFTTNCSQMSVYEDEDFEVHWTNWQDFSLLVNGINNYSLPYNFSLVKTFIINSNDYTFKNYSNISSSKELIYLYFEELDKKKKEEYFLMLKNKLTSLELNILFFLKLFNNTDYLITLNNIKNIPLLEDIVVQYHHTYICI